MKTSRSVLTFYKGFTATGLAITFLCAIVYLSWKTGAYVIVPLFWFKVVTYVLIWYYINNAKRKEFYYYHALGISKAKLWAGSIAIDFLLYVIIMVITNIYYHA